jgi:energy-coupling factor transporter ATP-binding protein EcfA2
MIESITFEKNVFPLVNKPEGTRVHPSDFFSVDTFSLLIGKNGSGKTTLLRKIAWAFHDTENITGVEVKFAPFKGRRKDPKKDYGIVYYTPIPYWVDLPKNTRNFYNATPTEYGRVRESLVDIEHYAMVSNALGVNLKPLAVMSYDRIDILNVIGRAILSRLASYKKQKSDLDLMASDLRLASVFKEVVPYAASLLRNFSKSLTTRFLRPGESESWSDKELSPVAAAVGVRFMLKLQQEIDNRLGKNSIAILSAVEKAILQNRRTAIFADAFIDRYLCDPNPSPDYESVDSEDPLAVEVAKRIKLMRREKKWAPHYVGERVGLSLSLDSNKLLEKYSRGPAASLVDLIWGNFSSGQLALLYQFSALSRAANELRKKGFERLLFLIDEGDIYLHTAWQRRYIELLNQVMNDIGKGAKSVQLILTSHSSTLLTDVPKNCVFRLQIEDDIPREPVRSFAATLEDIVNSTFETGSLGSFAQEKIKRAIRNIRAGAVKDEDLYIIEMIDDPILKREMQRLLAG